MGDPGDTVTPKLLVERVADGKATKISIYKEWGGWAVWTPCCGNRVDVWRKDYYIIRISNFHDQIDWAQNHAMACAIYAQIK